MTMRGDAHPPGTKRKRKPQWKAKSQPPAPAPADWLGTITLSVHVVDAKDCETAHRKVKELIQALPGPRMTGVCFENPVIVLKAV